MAKFLVDIKEVYEGDDYSGCLGIVLLGLIIVLPLLLYYFVRYSVSAIANHFWIPVLGWFFMDSAVVFWISVVLFAVLVFVFITKSEHRVLVSIAVILLLCAFMIVPSMVGLKSVFSRKAASETFERGLNIYKTDETITLESGEIIPQDTEFFCKKIDKGEYTITFRGVAVLDESFVPFEMKFEKSHFPLNRMEVTKDNVQTYYSINAFRNLINSIYEKHSDNFINDLQSKGVYPKKHENSDFFKEDIKKNGGVILYGKWFDNDFSENDESCYYFESKADFRAFKKIYKKNVSSFNKDCYKTTSSLGKAFASYGIGSRK